MTCLLDPYHMYFVICTQQIVKILMIDFIIISSHTLDIRKTGIILGKHEYYFISSITQNGTWALNFVLLLLF